MAEGFVYKMRLALSDLIKPKEKEVSEDEQEFHNLAIEVSHMQGKMNGQLSELLNIHSGYERETEAEAETQVEQMDRFMRDAFPNGLCEGMLDEFDEPEPEYNNVEHMSEQIANNATDSLQDSFDLGTAIMIGSILSMLTNDMDSNDILDMIDERIEHTEGLAELVSAVIEDLGH